MAFFEELGKKVSQTSQDAIKKTKNMADTAKLNSHIDAEEKVIRDSYSLIGKKYFDVFAENPDEQFLEFINTIKESYAKIDDYREQINKIKGVVICPSCGTENLGETVFCPKCGYKFPPKAENEPAEPVAQEENKCPSCGAALSGNSAFCSNCGQKIG